MTGIQDGDHLVVVNKTNYLNESRVVTVSGDTTADFTLDRAYYVSGTITEASTGDPISGVAVTASDNAATLLNDRRLSYSTQTNTTGDYRLKVEEGGDYSIIAGKNGYLNNSTVLGSVTSNVSGVDLLLSEAGEPYVTSANPLTYQRNRTETLQARVWDPNDDPLNATIYFENDSGQFEAVKTVTGLRSGDYVTADVTSQKGLNRWYVTVEDPTRTNRSQTFTYPTPNEVRIYNASDLTKVTTQVDATIASTESNYRSERTTSTGTLDLEGVPRERLLVQLEASGYATREVVVDEPSKAYFTTLAPDPSSTSDSKLQNFTLDDQTDAGLFPPSETRLVVERFYNGAWRTIGSEYFGGINLVDMVLQKGTTYRLTVVANSGASRNLGLLTYDPAKLNDPHTLVVKKADSNDTDEGDPPVARINYTPAAPTTSTDVTFDGTGSEDPDGSITEWKWDIGNDGSIESRRAVYTHDFRSGGNYTVALTVVDDDGQNDTVTRQLYVAVDNQPPIARMNVTPRNPIDGETVTFNASNSTDPDGDPLTYSWDINSTSDPGVDLTGETVTASYPDPGVTRNVTLTVEDPDGATSTAKLTLYVANNSSTRLAPPEARFNWTPFYPEVEEMIRFNASNSTGGAGNITKYEWDEGDGPETIEHTGKTASWLYRTNGTYTVTLIVTSDKYNMSDYRMREVTVGAGEPTAPPNPAPNASINVSPSAPAAGTQVTFNGSNSTAGGTNDSIVEYRWDLNNDGVTDKTGREITNRWYEAGTYQVTLTVEDEFNQTDTATVLVEVGERGNRTINYDFPPATVSIEPTVGSLPATETNVSTTIRPVNGTLQGYSVELLVLNGSNMSVVDVLNVSVGANPDGTEWNFTPDLSGYAGDRLRVHVTAVDSGGEMLVVNKTYYVTEYFDTDQSLLAAFGGFKSAVPAKNWEQFATMLSVLVTALVTATTARTFMLSTEAIGLVALTSLVGFMAVGMISYNIVFVAGAGFVGFAAIRRGI